MPSLSSIYNCVQYTSIHTRQWLSLVLERPNKLLILMSSAKIPVTYGMQRKCSNADADASNLYADPCAI